MGTLVILNVGLLLLVIAGFTRVEVQGESRKLLSIQPFQVFLGLFLMIDFYFLIAVFAQGITAK